jgi:hypothetical protein
MATSPSPSPITSNDNDHVYVYETAGEAGGSPGGVAE